MSDRQEQRYKELQQTFNLTIEQITLIYELVRNNEVWKTIKEYLVNKRGELVENMIGAKPLEEKSYLTLYGIIKGLDLFEQELENIASEYEKLLMKEE